MLKNIFVILCITTTLAIDSKFYNLSDIDISQFPHIVSNEHDTLNLLFKKAFYTFTVLGFDLPFIL
jgi:hypothetical protein